MDPKERFVEVGVAHRVESSLDDREARQREMNRAAEDVLLGDDSIGYQEYKRRREALPNLVIDPNAPLDQCSQRDYNLRRAAGEAKPRPPAPGEKSLIEFLDGPSPKRG